MDDDMQAMEVRDHEIEFRLEAYARARLSPDPQAVARSRARIMREARLQFEASQGAAALAPPPAIAARRPIARRVAMPLLAASLWAVLTVGSVFAAQAGGPLYPTRMWIETVTLPAVGPARVTAEINRLEARLGEAGAAAARGDDHAVQAALDAYRQISDEAIASTTGNTGLAAIMATALDRHRAVLTAVATKLGERGSDTAVAAVESAIQRAIAHNQVVIDRVDEETSGGGSGTGNPGGSGTGNPGGSGTKPGTGPGTGGGSGAAASAKPATGDGSDGKDDGTTNANGGGPDKPAKTPRPAPAATPDPTPKPTPVHGGPPDHSPRGQNP